MKKSDIILGFLVGASAGALLGLLLAPEKGIKTRRKLYKKGELAIDDIKDGAYILAAYVNEVNNEIDRLSDKVDAALEQAADEATLRIGEAITKFGEGKKGG
jgi:gas vesicle protein